jgi:hypothetical protein
VPCGLQLDAGSILMRIDEVVLCRFEGGASAVRRVAEAAAILFDRIVETVPSRRWTATRTPSTTM